MRFAAQKTEGVDIPSERTVYRVMKEIGLVHHPRRRPNGITRADREARKSDDLLKQEPRKNCLKENKRQPFSQESEQERNLIERM